MNKICYDDLDWKLKVPVWVFWINGITTSALLIFMLISALFA